MADVADDKSTVQCAEADKAVFQDASTMLRWTLPQVMHLAAEGLRRMIDGEETLEQRTNRMLEKLGSPTGRQVSNRSRTPVTHDSNGSVTPIEAAS